jgi:hypothetical protein
MTSLRIIPVLDYALTWWCHVAEGGAMTWRIPLLSALLISEKNTSLAAL